MRDALVDDVAADFGEPINVGFAGTKIAAFDRVVEQTVNAVAVVLIIFRGIDSALRRDRMGAARRILVAKAFHPITEFAQRCCGRTAGESGADDDDFEFAAIIWTNESRVILVARPFRSSGPQEFCVEVPIITVRIESNDETNDPNTEGLNVTTSESDRSFGFVLPSSFDIRIRHFFELLRRFDESEQDGDRDRGVADKKQPGENSAAEGKLWGEPLIIESKRLEEARRAVGEMERQQKQADNVKSRDVNVLKSVNHHRINVVTIERIEFEKRKLRIEFARGEMEQMKNDEGEHNQPAHDHVSRRPARFHVISVAIGFGPRAPILDREQNREINVQNHARREEIRESSRESDPNRADAASKPLIQSGPMKICRLPSKWPITNKNQDHAGDGDDHFPADRRVAKLPK